MDTDKIIEELKRRFGEPLPEFHPRRIIFWRDEDREFAERFDEIKDNLDNVKVVVCTETNRFAVKKLLLVDDPESDFLVYSPLTFKTEEDDWLLDVRLYSEEFRADLVSIWMEETQLSGRPGLRESVKRYSKFFNSGKRREQLKELSDTIATPPQLERAIMAVLADLDKPSPNAILRAVLREGLVNEENPVYQDFETYEVADAFWNLANQTTGADASRDDPELGELALRLVTTASARTLPDKILERFSNHLASAPYAQSRCYELVSEWLHGGDVAEYRRLAEFVERELRLKEEFKGLTLPELVDTELFPCVNEVVLEKLAATIVDDALLNPDDVVATIDRRRPLAWFDDFANCFEALEFVAKMLAYVNDHSNGYHTVDPIALWEAYTSEYYAMDSYYREFQTRYSEILINCGEPLSDLFKQIADKVEGLYKARFLEPLGECWTRASEDAFRELGFVPRANSKIPFASQREFYRRYVATLRSRNKAAYVIVSDALRYEVAATLAEELRAETQADVELESMQGVFPSTTKFGMAAILPNDGLKVELRPGKTERLAVLTKGLPTDATNREKLLRTAEQESVALQYKDIVEMKSADRKTLVKGMKVVYIYHNRVDEAGHAETDVFSACDVAIKEIKKMIRIVRNDWSGTNVLVTSDHGFLYTRQPLAEFEKLGKTFESKDAIEVGRRYAVMKKGTRPEFLMPVNFLEGESAEYDAFAPRNAMRVKIQGPGGNFVHGGASLQELVVPVVRYHVLRNQSEKYRRNRDKYDARFVDVRLTSAVRKICNLGLALDFYQTEPVGGVCKEATYTLQFQTPDGKQTVSDVRKIVANKTSDDKSERKFRVYFSLKPMKYDPAVDYQLVIKREEDGKTVARENFNIDIPLADNFGFDL